MFRRRQPAEDKPQEEEDTTPKRRPSVDGSAFLFEGTASPPPDKIQSQNEASETSGAAKDVEEPDGLVCSITHQMYKDPVFVPGSGNTYF